MMRINLVVATALLAAAAPGKPQDTFKVNRDGFSFVNYTNSNKPVNLKPRTLERLCGPGTCARGTKDTCVLSASMRAFMDQLNQLMSAGHCDGMAMFAEEEFKGFVKPQAFQKNAKSTYALVRTPELEEEIAARWTTQLLDPTHTKKLKNITANRMLEVLRNPGNESYTIHMFGKGYKNGHAVSAIRVEDEPHNMARVYIYDSNYPNQERYISVDKKENKWWYTDFPKMKKEKKILSLVPLSARRQPQKCPLLENADDVIDEDDEWDIGLDSDGLEFDLGDLIELFTGGANIIPVTDSRGSNFYEFKPGVERRIKLKSKGDSPTTFYFKAHGHVLSVEKIRPHVGKSDEIILGADGETLEYKTKQFQPIVLRLAVTYTNADYEIKITPTPREGGFDVYLHNQVDRREGNHVLELQIRNHDGTPNYYTLKIKRIGPTGDTDYSHRHKRELTLMPDEIDRIQYGKWLHDLQPLSILDVINGRVERESLVSDEN